MILQHNLSALNSHRQLSVNNKGASSNLEKLSSGYKINRAADDAAGLAISEKMRGQIRGLNMASQNASNGVSLIKTAEGGLNEAHSILHRMRELAVQSANGTYDDDVDRYNLNKEVGALKSELDRIASSTHYNGIPLLDGTMGSAGVDTLPGGGVAPVIWEDGSMAAMAEQFDGMGFNMSFFHNPGYNMFGNINVSTYDSGLNGETLDLIVMEPQDGGNNNMAIRIGGETYTGVLYSTAQTGVATANGFDASLAANTYAFFDNDGNLVATVEVNDTSNNHALGTGTGGILSGITVGDARQNPGDTSTTGLFPSTSGLENQYFAPGDALYGAAFAGPDAQLIFQIGANGTADQQVGLHVDNMSTINLGSKVPTDRNPSGTIRDISVDPLENANDAIGIIDAAINQVSGTRADLGSLQNRLEHTLNNLGVTAENLTAAESTIRDVDMAKEMMEFTKNNILVQSSQAMLAQSNQLPQGVLSLLQ